MVGIAVSSGGARAAPGRAAPFLTPEEALSSFQLEAGLRIELVAAEPLVVDPVAFAFDGPGRLYVVENRGYPDPMEGKPITHEGRVALIEDRDGDGKFDRRTEFATGLGYPNGIVLWRGGVFVTCAPDILYLKDTDGDGVADVRRAVLTGFDAVRTGQLRVSSPTFGLDGKIYVACGLAGGKVTSPQHPERPAVAFSSKDGRLDPDTLVYEVVGGRGQFGLTFDAYGRRFVSSNRHPVLHVVLAQQYLRRNPNLAFSDTDEEVSRSMAEARVHPISRAAVTADFIPSLMATPHSGTFTSACGVLIYDGDALTPAHRGNAFICEPAQNLVQRQVLRPEGASFRSVPPDEGKEFLASTDVWFRPVFLGNGPDGALYVADMYRREIDHPAYVPEESRAKFDFRSGKTAGRIYRIVRNDFHGVRTGGVDLRPESAEALVSRLESTNSWWREEASMRLLERGKQDVVQPLEAIAVKFEMPATRVRALWALRNLHSLRTAVIADSLKDRDAAVREQAVILAGEVTKGNPGLLDGVLAKAGDPDARVRFECALVLGDQSDPRATVALASIALRDGGDRWARAAVLSGIGDRMEAFLAAIGGLQHSDLAAYAAVMKDLGQMFGTAAPLEACRTFLVGILKERAPIRERMPPMLGLGEGLRSRPRFGRNRSEGVLLTLLGRDTTDATVLSDLLSDASNLVASEKAPLAERMNAAALLGYTRFEQAGAALGGLLDARNPRELQLQAVRALENFDDPRAGELLIRSENWEHYTPQLREAVIASLVSRRVMIPVLFSAIARGTIKPAEIAPVQRDRLLKDKDDAIRTGAEKAFGDLQGGDRMKVYEQYRSVLELPSDAHRGELVFTRVCSACHTFDGVGGHVGPDLSGNRNQPADALLLHILVPNYEVYPGYQAVSIATPDGRMLSGRILTETDASLTLRTAFGTDEVVMRSSILSLNASSLSLMPDGLEQSMTRDELADLIAYLKSPPPETR
ncbi:MAG: c-type cytochrome [Opitutaceae bacterium]|nr:c-type cytochrome [Opitutaceae bacterium]